MTSGQPQAGILNDKIVSVMHPFSLVSFQDILDAHTAVNMLANARQIDGNMRIVLTVALEVLRLRVTETMQ